MVVTVLCDLGVKYLSKVYNHNWLQEQGRVSLREWETLVTQDLPPLGVPRLLSDNHMPEPFNKREVLSRVLEDTLEVKCLIRDMELVGISTQISGGSSSSLRLALEVSLDKPGANNGLGRTVNSKSHLLRRLRYHWEGKDHHRDTNFLKQDLLGVKHRVLAININHKVKTS